MQSNQYRELAFSEHGEQCQRCGATEELEVHHRDRDREKNDVENLEVLCHGCHADEHQEERAERARKSEQPIEEQILDLLVDGRSGGGPWGRVTAPWAAEELDYSLQYCRDTLNRLVEHGHARKPYSGLYEFVDDPRGDGRDGSPAGGRPREEAGGGSE
jgi:hypothetical protein